MQKSYADVSWRRHHYWRSMIEFERHSRCAERVFLIKTHIPMKSEIKTDEIQYESYMQSTVVGNGSHN